MMSDEQWARYWKNHRRFYGAMLVFWAAAIVVLTIALVDRLA